MEGECTLICPVGLTDCNGACVDLITHLTHCGLATLDVVLRVLCIRQLPIYVPSGSTECNGQCYNLQTDVANCGECAAACPDGMVCNVGNVPFLPAGTEELQRELRRSPQ